MTVDPRLITALAPIVRRVRTDVTAVKRDDGLQAWTRQPLTEGRLAKHLNGGPARGVSPIKAGESVTLLAVLDFDSHGGETSWSMMSHTVATVAGQLDFAWGANPIMFRSSGGRGVHIYVLWDDPQDAYSVRTWLASVLRGCGLKPGVKGVQAGQVEVFPKQDEVPADGFGNQFVLPLAGQSELLALDDLSGLLVNVPRDAVLAMQWPSSPPVPRAVRPERGPVAREFDRTTDWLLALDALPNSGAASLDYDQWRNVVFAIHYETGGSDEGLALAEEFSARSDKADLEFLRNRVWPYVSSERGRVITGNTIMSIAGKQGWHKPLDDSAFSVVEDDESAEDPEPGAQAEQPAPPPTRRGVPAAQHRTTDQANANRLVKAYGSRALYAGDYWYVDDGRRWARDEAGIYRYACQLSRIVGEEARELERKKGKD